MRKARPLIRAGYLSLGPGPDDSVKYGWMNIRVDEEEAANLIFAYTHHHKKLTVVNTIKFRKEDVSTLNAISNSSYK